MAVVGDMRSHWRKTSPLRLSRSSYDFHAKLWSPEAQWRAFPGQRDLCIVRRPGEFAQLPTC